MRMHQKASFQKYNENIWLAEWRTAENTSSQKEQRLAVVCGSKVQVNAFNLNNHPKAQSCSITQAMSLRKG